MPTRRIRSGLFITFEGTEGAGKSTLIRSVRRQFENGRRGSCLVTREPGGNRLSEKIRDLILENKMDPKTELFLYEASRAEHVKKTILPALRNGKIILCDRFTDSSLAYQSLGRGLPWKMVKSLNEFATHGLKPDLTVLLDIEPKVGLKRARIRNRFERENALFHERVRKGFLKSRSEDPKRWLVIPAGSGTPEELAVRVVNQILKSK